MSIPGFASASSRSPYESGYDHGCNDADISDSSDRYINQPEKGPSSHTSEFMNGYDAGFNSCANNYSSGSNYEPESSSQNNQFQPNNRYSNSDEDLVASFCGAVNRGDLAAAEAGLMLIGGGEIVIAAKLLCGIQQIGSLLDGQNR